MQLSLAGVLLMLSGETDSFPAAFTAFCGPVARPYPSQLPRRSCGVRVVPITVQKKLISGEQSSNMTGFEFYKARKHPERSFSVHIFK